MGAKRRDGMKRGDPRFLIRLVLGAVAVIVFGTFLFGGLDRAQPGACAARGFLLVTEPSPAD